jgi:hypothetical protein
MSWIRATRGLIAAPLDPASLSLCSVGANGRCASGSASRTAAATLLASGFELAVSLGLNLAGLAGSPRPA